MTNLQVPILIYYLDDVNGNVPGQLGWNPNRFLDCIPHGCSVALNFAPSPVFLRFRPMKCERRTIHWYKRVTFLIVVLIVSSRHLDIFRQQVTIASWLQDNFFKRHLESDLRPASSLLGSNTHVVHINQQHQSINQSIISWETVGTDRVKKTCYGPQL